MPANSENIFVAFCKLFIIFATQAASSAQLLFWIQMHSVKRFCLKLAWHFWTPLVFLHAISATWAAAARLFFKHTTITFYFYVSPLQSYILLSVLATIFVSPFLLLLASCNSILLYFFSAFFETLNTLVTGWVVEAAAASAKYILLSKDAN